MKNCSYICGVSAKDKYSLMGCGIFVSAYIGRRNHGLPIPNGFCTVRSEIVFAEIGGRYALFLYPHNFSFMAKTMKDCAVAQGASAATSAHVTGSATQLSALLHDLCKAKVAIDDFYNSQTAGAMHDTPDRYLKSEGLICEAIMDLADYIGMFTADAFLTPKNA